MAQFDQFSRKSRHLLRLPCQVVRERDFRLIADRVDNLSTTGLLVSPAEAVLTGERLLVSFRLPREGVWVDAEARVTRVIHGRRPGEVQRALGLEFEAVAEESRAAIGRELSKVPPAPPGRARRDEVSSRLARVLGWYSARVGLCWQS
ncbi:MAG TPA: PilZ domain-containing protein [Polyangiaceae bacterium]|nr:PilZ domain-containing protein [Polyangiaceae bacterium]